MGGLMRIRVLLAALAALLASLALAPAAFALTPAGDGPWFWLAPQPLGTRLSDVAFADPGSVWASAPGGVLLHSTDSGLTWQRQQIAPTSVAFAVLAFPDPQHGFAVGINESGELMGPAVYRTEDGGTSWTDVAPDGSDAPFDASFADAEHGWLAAWRGNFFMPTGSLLATSNGGSSWQSLPLPAGVAPLKVALVDALHGYVGDLHGRVWSTSDGGTHWHRSDLGRSGMYSMVGALCFSDAEHGWAAIQEMKKDSERSRLLATQDGGQTWQQRRSLTGFLNDIDESDGRIYLTGTLDPAPAFVDESNDAGLSWTRHRLGGEDVYLDAIDASGDVSLAVGTQVVRTDDAGALWKSITSGTQAQALLDAAMVSATEGWAVGDGLIIHTSDGVRWQDQWMGSRELWGVSFPDVTNGWAVGDRGLVLHTQDGGKTWAHQDAGTTADLGQVDFPDESNGWALADPPSSDNLLALHTTDGGATWSKVKVAYNVYAEALRFYDAQQGWVAGLVGPSYGVLHTTDGGVTWAKQKLPRMDYLFDLFFLTEKEGWAAGGKMDDEGFDHAFLVHTSDGGATWTKLPEVYDALFRSCYFVDASHGWAAGDGGLFSTEDGGQSWHQDSASGDWDLTAVTGTDSAHLWAFGDRHILSSFDVAGDSAAPSTLNDADLLWHRTPITVTFSANDTGGSGLLRTEYRIDSDPVWHEGSSAAFAAPADHSGDGQHTLSYRSYDNAGNVELTQKTEVFIDTRRPRPVAHWSTSVRRGTKATLRYFISDRCPGTSETVTIAVRNARGRIAKQVSLRDVAPNKAHRYSFVCRLARGTYRFSVSATDAAGNTETRVATNRLVVK
jgi:photosystem II stability/assembly factor-like uncharacterized protein